MSIEPDRDLHDIKQFLTKLLRDDQGQEAVTMVVELLHILRKKNTDLELRIHKLLRQQYRRKIEGISSKQLDLFLQLLADKNDADAKEAQELDLHADDEDDEEEDGGITEVRSHKRRTKRRHVPPEIERQRHDHKLEETAMVCSTCEQRKTVFGHEICEILDIVPAHFVLHEHYLEKAVCRPCGNGVVTPEGPGKVIEGSLPGPWILADVLVDKYRDGLPLYRQIDRFKRLGMDIRR